VTGSLRFCYSHWFAGFQIWMSVTGHSSGFVIHWPAGHQSYRSIAIMLLVHSFSLQTWSGQTFVVNTLSNGIVTKSSL